MKKYEKNFHKKQKEVSYFDHKTDKIAKKTENL